MKITRWRWTRRKGEGYDDLPDEQEARTNRYRRAEQEENDELRRRVIEEEEEQERWKAKAAAGGRPLVEEALELLPHVPVVAMYQRPNISLRWRRRPNNVASSSSASLAPPPHRSVRIACLFAGFVRDVEAMHSSTCTTRRCRQSPKSRGGMGERLLRSTDCDVYVSTWDIRGVGRYDTTAYLNETVNHPVQLFQRLYGEQLAAVHVQRYEPYGAFWKYVNKFARSFPQVRPAVQYADPVHGSGYFTGVPELNHFLRPNDYSQAYKHWCVVQLVRLVLLLDGHKGQKEQGGGGSSEGDASSFSYDLLFRLRFDLRVTKTLSHFQFATHRRTKAPVILFRVSGEGGVGGAGVVHYVSSRRIHVHNFDISDFGFLGTPSQIALLSRVWLYCTARPGSALSEVLWVPKVESSVVPFSEYNYMLWRVIFEQRWEVDHGGRYLWVSRSRGKRRT